jgi:hypothetical protein
MADYVLPDVVEKRVRYFDGQFLQDQDFIDEQDYQLDREHRHNRLLHGPGIADGLTVTSTAPNQVTVAPGTAIDSDGNQLVLAQATTVDLPAGDFNDKQGIQLYISYLLSAEDPQTVGGSGDFTRWLERPQLTALAPGNQFSGATPPVLLANVALDNSGRVVVDNTVRSYSGLRLPGPAADAATLRATSGGLVDLAGSLTVDGNVGIGISSPGYPLHLAVGKTLRIEGGTGSAAFSFGGNGVFSIDAPNVPGGRFVVQDSGNVGVGTAGPGAKLEVAGGGGTSVDLVVNGRLRSDNNDGGLWVAQDRFVGGFSTNKIGFYNGGAWQFAVLNNGNAGIGTATPSARLSVVGPGATEIAGTAHSAVLRTSAGALGQTSGSEVALSSTGLSVGPNNVSLGVRAIRTANGTDWYTGAIGLGMDVDNTVRAGAALFLHANGNVGIGTTSPGAKLEVAGGGGGSVDLVVNGRLRSNNNDGGLWVAQDRFVGGFDTNKIGFYNGGAWRLAVLNNGYVGIGTTAPSAMLTVNGDLTFAAAPTTIRCDGGRLHITGGEILYLLNKSGVIVGKEWGGTGSLTVEGDLHTGGNVGIGTSDTGNQRLCVAGPTWLKGDLFVNGRLVYWSGSDWRVINNRQASGISFPGWNSTYAGSDGTSGPDTSDIRLKTGLRPISHALDVVRKLQGVRYRWGDSGLAHFTRDIESSVFAGPDATDEQNHQIRQAERCKALEALAGDRIGLVAQDVETVVPELVHEDEDGYKHIRYQHLTALLIEAIKEQDAVVQALSAQIAAFRAGQSG